MIDFQFIAVEPIALDHVQEWYEIICQKEGKQLGAMSVVLGTDEWLLEQNILYLNHDFYTDIITFDYTEADIVSGDLLISIDRVTENAAIYNVSRETELNRVIVHGLLHLCGYNDESKEEEKIIREKEDYYLSLL